MVSPDWASNAMDAAEGAAKAAVANLQGLLPCDPASGDQACVDKFITVSASAPSAARWIRPRSPRSARSTRVGAKNGGLPHGIEVVVRAMLQSPSFLYRLELGAEGRARRAAACAWRRTRWRRGCHTCCGTRCPTSADGRGRQRQAGQRRRNRGAGAPHAGRPEGARRRWAISTASGSASTAWARSRRIRTRYPQYNDKLVASMRTELRMFVDGRAVQGRRPPGIAVQRRLHLRRRQPGPALRRQRAGRRRLRAGRPESRPARRHSDQRRPDLRPHLGRRKRGHPPRQVRPRRVPVHHPARAAGGSDGRAPGRQARASRPGNDWPNTRRCRPARPAT